jgi:DNA polymerase V
MTDKALKTHGGRRPGAGRPAGSGRYSVVRSVRLTPEAAQHCEARGGNAYIRAIIERALKEGAANEQTLRVPRELPPWIRPVAADAAPVTVPRVDMHAACGFPSPAADYETEDFNLNDYFVERPAATYVVEASGDSMIDAGIHPHDILIVDRSLEPKNGDIVLAFYDGSFTVKRFFKRGSRVELRPENAAAGYPVLRPSPLEEFSVEGVVTGIGRRLRK